MIVETVDHSTVRAALQLAARAPSVHNTQPWSWRLGDGSVRLYADLRRWLPATDPDGRDLLMSCGAVLHHLRVALAALDVGGSVHRLPDPAEPDLLAVVDLEPGAAEIDREVLGEHATSIEQRRTDRRHFTSWPIPEGYLAMLSERAAEQGALLRAVTDPVALETLATAIRTAAAEHTAMPGYDTELAMWSGRRATPDGVPAASVPRPGAHHDPARRFTAGELEEPEGGEPDSATLLVLGTSSDDRLSQLRAGEAMSAVLLQTTALGLASSPLSEPLEVGGTRALLRDEVLGGTVCPQLVLRVGWPPAAGPVPPVTPRRSLADQVEQLPAARR